jgi:hypothetical protein
MPVYKCALGILLPRPDMQRVKSRQSEAIWGIEKMKDLSHELRRRAWMLLIPGAGNNEIVGTGQLQASVWVRFVEHDLGMRDVHDTAAHQGVIHEVKAHCPKVISAHATEFEAIPLVLGHLHVLKAFGRFPNTSEKSALLALLILRQFALRRCCRVRVDILRQCAQETDVYESERDQGILTLPRELSRVPGKSENLRRIQGTCLLFVKSMLIFRCAIADGSAGSAYC